MNRIMNELPPYYYEVKEFQELTRVQSDQLDLLDVAIQKLEDDQFILTSSEPAIARREKEFEILPDRSTESLDFRKKRLLIRMMQKTPFVFEFLIQQLNELLGVNHYEIELDISDFELEISIKTQGIAYRKEVAEMLERIVPLNIWIELMALLSVGKIIISDDSYSYPVYYKTCGKFSGEKEFSQSDVGDIDVTDDTYDYAVEYSVSEKQFMQIDSEPITAIDDTYSFVKDYDVCGVMSTLDKNVTTLQSSAKVDGAIYNVGVHYPVCGEFYAEGE